MAIDRNKISKLAENHMAMGRVDRAIEEYLKLIEDRADDNLLNRVGDAYLQAGKVPEALELFKKACTGFERSGFNNKATAVLKKAHRVSPEDVEIAERLAELYRQTNLIKEAIQIHIEVADICTRKGLIKRALEEFAKVVDLDPKNLKNKVKLADLYNKEGMKERAASIYLEVAEALALEQMHSEAGQILERARTMVTTPQVFLTQSRLCVMQKDLTGASRHLREGLGLNPRSAELLDALAEVELQARSPERALEALAQVPQLAEKSLQLCERALRELARNGQGAAGLDLFKPIGREFARRGLGEAAARTIRAAMQGAQPGAMPAEAWLQLSDIAHQGGNRAEEVECLRHAVAEAADAGDQALAEATSARLQDMGVKQEEVSAPFAPPPPAALPTPELEVSPIDSQETEQDVIRRMLVQKLQRDAAHFLQNRFMDSALDSFNRILELEPTNLEAINAIVDIHRASGMLTKVQLHYVKTAEKVAPLGYRSLAVDLLDRAEAMFPGSTRLYRRTLGLLDVKPAYIPPVKAPIAMPAPVEEGAPISLDLERHGWPGAPAPAAPAPAVPPAPAAPSAPAPLPEAQALLEPVPPAPEIPQMPEYDWAEVSSLLAGQQGHEAAGFPPLPEEPASAPVAELPVPEVGDDLASILSDIDFQLDYGSPEEALIEIENAFGTYAGHPELLRRKAQAEESLRRMGREVRVESLQMADAAPTFFDLTDVLGDALLEPADGEEMHDATHLVEKIQSVDELFNAFRAGVEKQVKGDDYDTHYNLGIAYKEMLLLDPAIEEFKTAMMDPERTLECCSMLAICEQSRGNLDAAVEWLRKGIEAPGFPPEDAIGLRYDLGGLLRAQNRHEEAQEEFRWVHGQDPYYRDVARMLG
ncbi:MAG: tetratricopeptide repeat protein [Holophaga sp.]|jgi:tetratricopeptide (TPR) repeat protein